MTKFRLWVRLEPKPGDAEFLRQVGLKGLGQGLARMLVVNRFNLYQIGYAAGMDQPPVTI